MNLKVEKVEDKEKIGDVIKLLENANFDGDQQVRRCLMEYLSKPQIYPSFELHVCYQNDQECQSLICEVFLFILSFLSF